MHLLVPCRRRPSGDLVRVLAKYSFSQNGLQIPQRRNTVQKLRLIYTHRVLEEDTGG